ncbi:MAG TPA: AAA domain-containing protein [Thermomicrobiaceae bacterium]|nr:AAA domain-containing protein [Thermomicrobiaceae bacterium]
MGEFTLAVPPDASGVRAIAPTDIAQFIRLDQCRRYLRLKLHERAASLRFLKDYDVAPQAIPPLLTASGARFEETVEAAIGRRFRVLNLARDLPRGVPGWSGDNERVLAAARELPPGETLVLLQPRIEAVVADWRLRGDIDLLRLERAADGELTLLIADMKSSTAARIEHRLQVALYHEMLATLLDEAGVAYAGIALGVLYRGSEIVPLEESDEQHEQRRLAGHYFSEPESYLELIADPDVYRASVRDLVTGRGSAAERAAEDDFAAIPFNLNYKCDGCLYNEFCMKWCAEHDDLSLLPHLSGADKRALERAGVVTTRQLAALKEPAAGNGGQTLVPAPGNEALIKRLGASYGVGPHLDELIERAREYQRFQRHEPRRSWELPSLGYGSLPYSDEAQNPNLITVYIDAQHDYLHDRIYLAGSLVVARRGGKPLRRRSLVHLAPRPVEEGDAERDLLVAWVRDTLRAIVELAEPDAKGEPNAPVHLVLFNSFGRDLLLQGLARHFETVLGLTPLYDFMTQLAAFDSPVLTFLDEEIRELKNYPMVCQSLQSVATFLKFDWSTPKPFRRIFRERLFDYVGKLGGDDGEWYTRRARFNSQIPLEYAYAAWRELQAPAPGERDDYGPYRHVTPELLRAFQARRLEALECIAADFKGNKQTQKTAFRLPDLNRFTEKARNLAQALDEFVTIERHAALSAWKNARLAPPERRVLSGDTLLVRYRAAEQDVDARVRNRQNRERYERKLQLEREYLAANPGEARATLTKEQKAATKWTHDGLRFRLELSVEGCDCDLEEALTLSTLREGERVVISPRWDHDSRLPAEEQTPYTPTAKGMLYKARADIERIVVARDDAGRAVSGHVEVEMREWHANLAGFTFSSFAAEPFEDGALYTLDSDPNDIYGYWCSQLTQDLCQRDDNPLYQRLAGGGPVAAPWPEVAAGAQARFFAGLEELQRHGAFEPFETSKRDFIAAHGATATLLVQGPPGTGKSFGTAYALLARLQGAMAAERDFRVIVACKTHAATDVLLDQLVRACEIMNMVERRHPDIFRDYFDARLLDLPLFRVKPKGGVPDGVIPLRERQPKSGDAKMAEVIERRRWCVVAATPGGVRAVVKEKWTKELLGHELCDCLVLDEASQLSLPEAIMAGLLLRADAPVIVVGDHRQMPPIVQHDWDAEARRTFKEYRSYESLFNALLAARLPMVKFAESFRLHAAMAEFLRQEVYAQDGIPYFSRQESVLPPLAHDDPFVAAVLRSEHPLVVIVHDEAASQVRNPFEQALIAPVLEALADPATYHLDAKHGLGVVVPHRAQRAALKEAVPALSTLDPLTGEIALSAVDTVERFQGGERDVIVVSATESDREYLLVSGDFLLDPRRLTVALSRARHKMILLAARSIFQLFSADEETFAHAQLWKNLLRTTCTVPLWQGERAGHHVEVWGNRYDHEAG